MEENRGGKIWSFTWRSFNLNHLFACANIKNDEAGGMGMIRVGFWGTSDIRLGRADVKTRTSSS